jgi:hypothetical protein
MRKAAVLALVAALACVSIVCAQDPAPAIFVAQPSLISDVTIHSDDSALVRAAKTAVANRMREAARANVVINDVYLRNSSGRISEGTGSVAPLPQINAPRQNVEQSTAPPAVQNAYGAKVQGQEWQRLAPTALPTTTTDDPGMPRTSQNTTNIPDNQMRPNPRP